MSDKQSKDTSFDYDLAFSRNIGFVTAEELTVLKRSKVAIGGMGGVGGGHLITLIRMGVEKFHIADFDSFSIENFNRQFGANMNTVGRNKADVMREMALQINPNCQITCFNDGITAENISDFFRDVDLYIDGLDFFAFQARDLVFKYCEKNKIPVITVGPIGLGASLITFLPGQMSFHEYFQWKPTDSQINLAFKFLAGLSPALPSRRYLVDPSAANLNEQRGPSSPIACSICFGVAGAEALKILLKRGPVKCAPHTFHYDAYLNHTFHSWIPWGNKNPLQRLKIFIFKLALTPKKLNVFIQSRLLRKIRFLFYNFLPFYFRKAMIRNSLRINYNLPDDVTFKVATTKDEFEQAFKLTYEAYLSLNLINPTAEGLRINKYFAIPGTMVLVAKQNDEVIATMSLISDSALGLPLQSTWNLSSLRQRFSRIAEVSALTIKPSYRQTYSNLYLILCKYMYEIATNYAGFDCLVISTKTRVRDFYRALLLFEPIESYRPKRYAFANSTKAVAQYLDLTNFEQNYKKAYGDRSITQNLHHFFTRATFVNFQYPRVQLFKCVTPSMSSELLEYFYKKKTKIFDSLTDSEKRELANIYAQGENHVVFGTSHFKGRELRCQVTCPANLISFTKSKFVYTVITEVSAHGVRLRFPKIEDVEPVKEKAIIKFTTLDGSVIQLDVVIRWVNGQECGCQILTAPNEKYLQFIAEYTQLLGAESKSFSASKTG